MEKITRLSPAFDKRHKDPSKDYGIHGVDLVMVLKGELGATQFVLYTNWQLPHVMEEQLKKSRHDELYVRCFYLPMPADIGYHSPIPQYDGQSVCQDRCEFLNEAPCYYDGSGLRAEEVYHRLLNEGDDGVWKQLEEDYVELFGELR